MSKQQQLSAEMIKNIEAYGAKEIETIELFVDSVRQNPGEYLSSIGNEGFMNCIREVFQNSADEMERDNSPCNKIWLEYKEIGNVVTVKDNGRALPPDIIIRVFCREHTSTNFKKKLGVYPSGLHGVGSKCVNAVSSRFSVTSYRLGKGYHIDFCEGKPMKKYNMQPKEIPNKQNYQGLIVEFEPDYKIMKKITITCEDVLRLAANLVPLFHHGAEVEFTGYKADGTVIHETMINNDGIIEYLIKKTEKPLIKPIIFGYDNGTMKANIALTYEANLNSSPDVITFANMTPVNTSLSTPSQGFFKGLCDFLRQYMNKIYLANSKKKLEVTNGDCMTGLKAAVTAAHISVMFDGQAKNVCKNDDLFGFVKDLTFQSMNNWSKDNPDDVQKLCGFIKDVTTTRTKQDNTKDLLNKKYKGNSLTSLPPNFIKAENKDHLELFIVEGLSASSPCSDGRDSKTQAIYPIRGKMLNCMTTPREKALKNEEIAGLINIIGAGYGNKFDISKCKYDKIILLPDADSDGYHISTLILKFFLVYCRPLVEAGRVYRALSPLYNVDQGTKKWKYFIDKSQFHEYVINFFSKNYTIENIRTGKKFTKDQIIRLVADNEKYYEMMYTISRNLSIHPVILEDVMILRNQPYKQFFKALKNKYKYVSEDNFNGINVLKILAFDMIHTIVLNSHFSNSYAPLLPYIDHSDKRYLLNKQKVGLYEILKAFKDSEPKNIERAKGLGALDGIELGVSTLDPENRTLIRFTSTDIEKEIDHIRRVDDDKFSLLKGVDISEYEF